MLARIRAARRVCENHLPADDVVPAIEACWTVIERFFKRLYGRRPAHYVDLVIALLVLAVLGFSAIHIGVAMVYIHRSLGTYVDGLAVGEVCMLAGAAVWVPFLRRRLRPLCRWGAGARGQRDAAAAWECLVVGLPRATVWTSVMIAVASLPGAALFVPIVGIDWGLATIMDIVLMLGIACGTVFVYLLAEVALAEMAREIDSARPDRDTQEIRGVTMSAKLLVVPPAVGFYTGLIAAGLARESYGAAGRFAIGIGAVVALSSTLSLGATFLLRRSLFGPVDALVRAAERVRVGQLDVAVPTQAEDELGTLTHAFNRMVEGLREREALQVENSGLSTELRASLDRVRRQADELQESRVRLVSAGDAARRQIERDLHDGAQQRLVLMGLKLGIAARAVESDAEAKRLIEEARSDLGNALEELRNLAHGIYPSVLESDGLPGALRDVAIRSPMPIDLECDGASRYAPEVEAAVYFCCTEALQNCLKHAGPNPRATVRLSERRGSLRFEIADKGAGFDQSRTGASAGIQNMADRIGALRGALEISSAPGAGTVVRGELPVSRVE